MKNITDSRAIRNRATRQVHRSRAVNGGGLVQYYSELPLSNYVPCRKEDRQITQEEMRRVAALEYGRCGGNTGYEFGYRGNSSLIISYSKQGDFPG